MRTILSTLRRPGRARATRRLRSSRIGAVADADLAMANPTAVARMANPTAVARMANPTAVARMANQITNPLVGAMVGVQVAAEDANNASIRPVTEFG